MDKIKEHYCTVCGKKMIKKRVPAEECIVVDYGWGDCWRHRLASAYDQVTGQRNYGEKFVCPNYKKRLIGDNGHDCFTGNEVIKVTEKNDK